MYSNGVSLAGLSAMDTRFNLQRIHWASPRKTSVSFTPYILLNHNTFFRSSYKHAFVLFSSVWMCWVIILKRWTTALLSTMNVDSIKCKDVIGWKSTFIFFPLDVSTSKCVHLTGFLYAATVNMIILAEPSKEWFFLRFETYWISLLLQIVALTLKF